VDGSNQSTASVLAANNGYVPGVKGDRVEIVVDAGGETKTYEVAATKAGRRVEIVNRRGLVEVSEVTRGGTAVRTARFMATRVIALVEHPASSARASATAG
jgi:hypothetical protein